MRKLIVLLFAMLLVLASCGDTNEVTVTTEAATAEPTLPFTEETQPPVVEPTLYKLSFIAAGDNIAYNGNMYDAKKNAAGTDKKYDFTPSYTDIKPIVEQYDLAFINQETLMCGEGFELSSYPRFNSPQELGDAVVDAGFDIVGLANNHMLDKGEKGLIATLDYWDAQEVTHIGAYRNREDFDNIRVVEKNGIKIAFLSFTYATNGISVPKDSEVYIPYINNEEIAAKVTEAETLADITIVSMHWGNENNFNVSDEQRELAALICEKGGDVIIGHHPHVIQPIEWVEQGENRMLCIYSLGNFMAEMARGYNMLGGMVSFDIEKLGELGKPEVKNVLFTPTVFHFNSNFRNNHIYLLEEYTEDMAKAHGISHYGNSTSLKTLTGYVTKNIAEEFLPDFLKSAE